MSVAKLRDVTGDEKCSRKKLDALNFTTTPTSNILSKDIPGQYNTHSFDPRLSPLRPLDYPYRKLKNKGLGRK